MKKIFLSILACFAFVVCSNAQILRAEELERYAKERYGGRWEEAAGNLADSLSLDKNNALTYVQIIEAPGKTKGQLYIMLNYWYSATFNSGKAVIQLNDKDAGVIIGKGFVEKIAKHTGGVNKYTVHLEPIIKTDIKDNKIRVTYTIPFYTVVKMAGAGYMYSGSSNARPVRIDENWVLDECFPFTLQDNHKKTSSKALVMAHAYSNVVMDKIEEAVKNGLVGNETEEW
ncbi:MAG: DUF4468 domain-containing protein [Paraprevotella sp.]|nr:DUF4468 domain-containing protein [Paraprevotella sp.]